MVSQPGRQEHISKHIVQGLMLTAAPTSCSSLEHILLDQTSKPRWYAGGLLFIAKMKPSIAASLPPQVVMSHEALHLSIGTAKAMVCNEASADKRATVSLRTLRSCLEACSKAIGFGFPNLAPETAAACLPEVGNHGQLTEGQAGSNLCQ